MQFDLTSGVYVVTPCYNGGSTGLSLVCCELARVKVVQCSSSEGHLCDVAISVTVEEILMKIRNL